jgi:hypothetical protein
MMIRRHEPGIDVGFPLSVCGINTRGERFIQEVQARSISVTGALLSHMDAELRTGDVIGVLYAGKKARFRVIWARSYGASLKVQAAIHCVESDECPWLDLLSEEPSVSMGA